MGTNIGSRTIATDLIRSRRPFIERSLSNSGFERISGSRPAVNALTKLSLGMILRSEAESRLKRSGIEITPPLSVHLDSYFRTPPAATADRGTQTSGEPLQMLRGTPGEVLDAISMIRAGLSSDDRRQYLKQDIYDSFIDILLAGGINPFIKSSITEQVLPKYSHSRFGTERSLILHISLLKGKKDHEAAVKELSNFGAKCFSENALGTAIPDILSPKLKHPPQYADGLITLFRTKNRTSFSDRNFDLCIGFDTKAHTPDMTRTFLGLLDAFLLSGKISRERISDAFNIASGILLTQAFDKKSVLHAMSVIRSSAASVPEGAGNALASRIIYLCRDHDSQVSYGALKTAASLFASAKIPSTEELNAIAFSKLKDHNFECRAGACSLISALFDKGAICGISTQRNVRSAIKPLGALGQEQARDVLAFLERAHKEDKSSFDRDNLEHLLDIWSRDEAPGSSGMHLWMVPALAFFDCMPPEERTYCALSGILQSKDYTHRSADAFMRLVNSMLTAENVGAETIFSTIWEFCRNEGQAVTKDLIGMMRSIPGWERDNNLSGIEDIMQISLRHMDPSFPGMTWKELLAKEVKMLVRYLRDVKNTGFPEDLMKKAAFKYTYIVRNGGIEKADLEDLDKDRLTLDDIDNMYDLRNDINPYFLALEAQLRIVTESLTKAKKDKSLGRDAVKRLEEQKALLTSETRQKRKKLITLAVMFNSVQRYPSQLLSKPEIKSFVDEFRATLNLRNSIPQIMIEKLKIILWDNWEAVETIAERVKAEVKGLKEEFLIFEEK